MPGIRHGMLVADIERRRHAEAAGEGHRLVGEDVAEHVAGENDVVALGPRDEIGGHGVDVDLAQLHLAMHGGELLGLADEKAVAHLQHVALAHHGDPPAPALCVSEGHLGDAA